MSEKTEKRRDLIDFLNDLDNLYRQNDEVAAFEYMDSLTLEELINMRKFTDDLMAFVESEIKIKRDRMGILERILRKK